MGASISEQTVVFLAMSLCGALVGVLFDLFRSFRLLAKPRSAVVHLSDFLFCLLGLILLFSVLVHFNGGQLRWYVFLGTILGAVLYFSAISSYVLRFLMFTECMFVKIIRIILKILLTPARFLYKILIVPMYQILRKAGKKIRCIAKDLTRGAAKAMTKDKTQVKPRQKKKRTKLLPVLFIGLLSVMFVRGVMQQPQITKNKEQAAQLQRQIEYEEKRIEEVDSLKEKVNTDEYIEKVAQEKLGLVKREAKIFIDAADK